MQKILHKFILPKLPNFNNLEYIFIAIGILINFVINPDLTFSGSLNDILWELEGVVYRLIGFSILTLGRVYLHAKDL